MTSKSNWKENLINNKININKNDEKKKLMLNKNLVRFKLNGGFFFITHLRFYFCAYVL